MARRSWRRRSGIPSAPDGRGRPRVVSHTHDRLYPIHIIPAASVSSRRLIPDIVPVRRALRNRSGAVDSLVRGSRSPTAVSRPVPWGPRRPARASFALYADIIAHSAHYRQVIAPHGGAPRADRFPPATRPHAAHITRRRRRQHSHERDLRLGVQGHTGGR